MPNNDDEMRRRNEEMSMFAAYASITNADDDATKNNSNGSPFDGSSLLLLKPSASQGDDGDSCHLEADDVRFHDVSSKSSAMVAAPNKEEENANLSAAVAALSKGDGDNQQNSCARLWPAAATALHSHRRIRGTNAVKVVTAAPDLTAEDAMFAEEVVMPRPLFFGAIVPPRVLQAAKEMVEAAIEEMQAEGISSPRLHDLPDAVRNVVGTLRTYGFGLDTLLPCNRKPINSDVFSTNSKKRASFRELKSNEPWRGDGTVSTFQPVWGSDERTERIRKYKANRKPSKPAVISRISTAPPVMSAFTDDDESQDDEKSLDTEVTPSIHINSLTAPTVQRTSIKQFSAWLRSNDDEETMMTVESPFNLQSVGSSSQDGAEVFPNAAYAVVTSPEQLSEQEKFSQWALGSDSVVEVTGSAGKSYIVDSPSTNMGTFQFTAAHPFNASTFQQLHSNVARSRDDDEQNTQVGANDNLSKAIALLSEECSQAPDTPVVEPQVLLSQVDGSRKRPLTNYELTGGCVPIFSVDDTPLPHESDLGLHETKEEQRRSFEQKRSQEIIEKVVPPNVFGPVACPNPAINPDDFHAWNTRAIASQRAAPVTSATSIASDPSGFKRSNHGKTSSELMNRPALHSRPPKHPSKNPKNASKKRFTASRQRFGWWNELVETEDDAQTMEEKDGGSSKGDETDDLPSLHLPPAYHSSSSMHVFTPLEPSPEKLRDDNLPLSRMHAATSMAQTLPYLSDRPHSFRYLQVETQQIAFPPLKDEIEPLFCSMAIYNVETISSDMSMGVQSSLPIPDLQRCGRVTEALHFDHVTNTDVEARCGAALWPYSSNILSEKLTTSLGKEEKLCGTKCGVFPLPSNLNVANLYAVLIVRKVLSDEANLEPYLKLRKSTFDLDKLKQNAEKASNRNGKFVVPFAFGVAPLLQVFGTDNPVVASSRAVQIPLFHFSDGERQIFDHIMVMLFPRVDHKVNGVGGPAPVTNGGTAMLVMRNFGYLGLHCVVDSRSSLARDRLVDFTGELQLRRQTDDDDKTEHKKRSAETDNYRLELASWHHKYIAEPALNGGRNCSDSSSEGVDAYSVGASKLYAQELAPLPLMLAPSSVLSSGPQAGMARVRPSQDDIEPFYHTSFCNELLCHPRILHNCQQGHISIKVELREIEWNDTVNAYFAHLPRPSIGPSVHNIRRGPSLVQGAFTSCTSSRGDHQFIDEFKIRLPLDLNPRNPVGRSRSLSLFFTVYRVKTGSKSRWKRGAKKIFGSSILDLMGNSDDVDPSGHISQIACGFLPLTMQSCLIDNGMHDVRVVYKALHPPEDIYKQGNVAQSSLMLVESELPYSAGRDESFAEDASISNDSFRSDRNKDNNPCVRTDSSSDLQSLNEDSISGSAKNKVLKEPIALSVRVVVYSSLHSQNLVLNDLLSQESDLPILSYLPNKVFMATLRMGRDYLTCNAQAGQNTRVARVGEKNMLDATIGIADLQLCAMSRSAGHLLRIMPLLWRSLICGDGEPDLVWANPAASIPLRVHSFATILHLVGTSSLYLAQNGVTQVDGTSKWNFVVQGRVLALLFDESKLFGQQAGEKFDESHWLSSEVWKPTNGSPPSKKAPPKRRGHVRQTFELGNDIAPRAAPSSSVANFVSNAGDLATLPKPWRADSAGLPWPFEIEFGTSRDVGDLTASLKPDVKRDTKFDFQSFLRAAAASSDVEVEINVKPGSDRSKSFVERGGPAKALMQAYGGLPTGSNRRYMTLPANTLSTIPELGDDTLNFVESNDTTSTQHENSVKCLQASENNVVASLPTRSTRQMRRPRVAKGVSLCLPAENEQTPTETQNSSTPLAGLVPTSDDDVTTMGDAFLDRLSVGICSTASNRDGEEKHVGSSHHRRRTKGRSSIDWSLVGDEREPPTLSGSQEDSSSAESAGDGSDENMCTMRKEESSAVKLPSFIERLVLIGTTSCDSARWFPFAYEVIIMQWAAFLIEQRKSVDKFSSEPVSGSEVNEVLNQAAMRAVGVAVASAPMLFEVIKKSLGFRVKHLFDNVLSKKEVRVTPPLVILDETLLLNLVQLVSMLTDACIDSRNFDSWDLRQMSIDVNDAIVRFLRDLFSFLAPRCVHRLIIAYLSRFVTKDGKNCVDRDSLIGLRCSWEITKLRLNAVTAFVRFPDFIKVNSPQMLNWDNWWTGSPPPRSTGKFFDDTIISYQRFRLPEFVGPGGGDVASLSMRPHWLAEIVVDICLLGTEHAEQYIQHRSASLLHEMIWSCSQESILYGISAPVASMFITMLEKVVLNASYLSNFSPKSQLRKDVLSSCIFVLQSTPPNLLRALWRRLSSGLPGKGTNGKNGSDDVEEKPVLANEVKEEPDILGMFSVLNLSLRTIEYEGSDENIDGESSGEHRENVEVWRKEYLLSKPSASAEGRRKEDDDRHRDDADYTSSTSRKWQAHDGSMVIIKTGHHIVREMYIMLSKSSNGKYLLNPAVRSNYKPVRREGSKQTKSDESPSSLSLSLADTIMFVRAATSLYLHALALPESDIVVANAFVFSAEVIKIFGIEVFLEAVGETLQHWMRVILLFCGARRAQVRIEASDLLELILRSTWECFGSFVRIRVPLLAVQTEVMERIVATAAARYYREQRRLGTSFESFTNLGAEASLVPLWRTLDRIQKKPASQHVAFRGALIRLAGKLKKLYRAYVAARVLSFIKSNRDKAPVDDNFEGRDYEADPRVRASRISILRVINASEGHSKQFLGFQGTSQQCHSVAHFEAVEDALIAAANVFSPTELPEHRVAWLRMLAEFHSSRKKYAEEATCHYYIHVTLHLAARLHGSLWSNTPFLPWTDNIPDPIVYIDGDTAPAADPDCSSESNLDDWESGGQMENSISFRRIFYRVANSIGIGNNEWESGESKTLFYGITFPSEYCTISPWITLRQMEEDMVEEVEAAGALFLRAGIIESSRFAWNLATQYYAEKFNYAKLALTYGNLARAVISQVPSIDISLPQEVSTTLGRFYRVWFHGGAPDDLNGVEFVYRTQGAVRLKEFGEELRGVIMSIIPNNTPVHLILDGLSEETVDESLASYSGYHRIGPAPIEPVRIKVTPLRPLFGDHLRTRGVPEWFHNYADEMFPGPHHRSQNEITPRGTPRRIDAIQIVSGEGHDSHHAHNRSYSATVFSSAGSSAAATTGRKSVFQSTGDADRISRFAAPRAEDLSGVDKFCFVQPKNRSRPKEWWKTTSGDFALTSLRVTQLQVAESFPACVARQVVAHRLVYSQSPLEAGIDAVSQWCAVLFRTAVATSGMSVIKTNLDPGIGSDAAKVVADCIHNSNVKEIGLALLKKHSELLEDDTVSDFTIDSGKLSEDEIAKLQLKLARLVITFVELLHLLIGRNRDMLLDVIQERKKNDGGGSILGGGSMHGGGSVSRGINRALSMGQRDGSRKNGSAPSTADINANPHSKRNFTIDSSRSEGVRSDDAKVRNYYHTHVGSEDNQSYLSMMTSSAVRTDSAIAVQSELQRAFISLTKALYKNVHGILHEETPRWLKQGGQDNYFSLGTYRQTKIPIAEELCITAGEVTASDTGSHHPFMNTPSLHSEQGYESPRGGSVGGESQNSVISRGSERYGFGQF